jgi:UrcA family protein
VNLSFESVKLATPAWAMLLYVAISPAAHAGAQSDEKERVASVRVVYADLDLTREADVRILLDRIEKAAYRACGGNPRQHWTYGAMPELTTAAFAECREDAIARTLSAIDAPALTQARGQPGG